MPQVCILGDGGHPGVGVGVGVGVYSSPQADPRPTPARPQPDPNSTPILPTHSLLYIIRHFHRQKASRHHIERTLIASPSAAPHIFGERAARYVVCARPLAAACRRGASLIGKNFLVGLVRGWFNTYLGLEAILGLGLGLGSTRHTDPRPTPDRPQPDPSSTPARPQLDPNRSDP